MTDNEVQRSSTTVTPVYKPGNILLREGGRALVLSLSMDKRNPHKLYGYRVTLRRSGEADKEATLNLVRDMPFWKLAPEGTVWEAAKPMDAEIAALEAAAAPGSIVADNPIIQQLQSEMDTISNIAAARLLQITELNATIASLETKVEELIESFQSAVDHDAAGADYRAELADNLTAAPCREFKIVWDINPAELEKMEREEWHVQHMQFVPGVKRSELNVVYSRYVQSPAPQPERKATVAVVGPHIIVQPVEAKREPSFNAAEYMLDTLVAAGQKAESALAEAMPLYNAITSHPALLSAKGSQS